MARATILPNHIEVHKAMLCMPATLLETYATLLENGRVTPADLAKDLRELANDLREASVIED